MPEIANARLGAGAARLSEPAAHPTPFSPDPQRAGAAIGNALIALPDRPAGEHAAELALVLRSRLSRDQNVFCAGAHLLALDTANAEMLIRATWHDIRAATEIPMDRVGGTIEIERERQRRMWTQYCRRSRYQAPPLTREQQRRAATITFDPTPRQRAVDAYLAMSRSERREFLRIAEVSA